MSVFDGDARDVNRMLRDQVVRQSSRVSRAIAAIIRMIRRLWGKTSRKLVDITRTWMSRVAGRGVLAAYTKRFRNVLTRQAKAVRDGMSEIRKAVIDELRTLGDAEAAFVREMLGDVASSIQPPKFDREMRKIAINRNVFIGKTFGDHLSKIERDAITAIHAAMRQGIVNGESLDRIVKRIQADGAALKISARNIERIVDAASVAVSNRVRREMFKAAGFSGFHWSAILDSKTCPTCVALHGEKFSFSDPESPIPPEHPYCRCAAIPYVGSQSDIPDDVDAHEWLESQPESVQNEVLGKVRAQLWRDGKLPRNLDPRILLDANNRPRRLKSKDIERILGRDRQRRIRDRNLTG